MNLHDSNPTSSVSTEPHPVAPAAPVARTRTKRVPKRPVAARVSKERPVAARVSKVASAPPIARGKFGPKPRSNPEKVMLYLTKIDSLTASSYDIAHLLGFSGNWAPVQAVSVLEQLVRIGKIKKMKMHGETRYAHL